MKLAEALILRADMQRKLQKLRERLATCAIVQEGDKPAENPNDLLRDTAAVVDELTTLVERIQRTNHAERLDDGRPLASLMSERDALRHKLASITFAVEKASTSPDTERYSMREIRWVPQLDVRALNMQIDELSSQIRVINTRLQEANWKIELRA